MLNLLNKGLNFSVKPLYVNLADILTDFKKFERTVRWKEFFHEKETVYSPPIFKKEKTNLPTNHQPPRNLKVFLNTVESNIQDKSKWNKPLLNPKRMNIPTEEYAALQELIKLQREKTLIIKPADKGAGIVIMNYSDYVESCKSHLTSAQPQPSPLPPLPYYSPSSNKNLQDAKRKILSTLETAKDNDWISNDEFKAMDPSKAGPGKFYSIFKVHKPTQPDSPLPPVRPIVSGNGCITENISKFLDHHAKPLVETLPAYLQDTPDFLRHLEAVNQRGPLPESTILVTIDVCALYTNIPKEDGMSAMEEALNTRQDQKVPTSFLLELLEIALSSNIFEFDKKLFIQNHGISMGMISAPTIANITMGDIDKKLCNLAVSLCPENPLELYKRFIDDIFLIWTGGIEKLQSFLEKINSIHPTLKFTAEFTSPFKCSFPPSTPHDCFCRSTNSIPFLDTQVSVSNGQLVTDLYRKPTDRCQYLLPSSCHPVHITKNIPYSLCYRLVRICSDRNTLLSRFDELRNLLLSRDYPPSIIEQAISRALTIPRSEALKKVTKKKMERVVYTTTYHPALPSYSSILKSAWKVMIQDSHLKEVFPKPPMVAYRQPKQSSLKELLVKTKLPDSGREQRILKGMKKCNIPKCNTCPFIHETQSVISSASDFSVQVKKPLNCNSSNVVYCISCDKSSCDYVQYIGESGRKFKDRFSEHIGYVKSGIISQPTGQHFNLPGHSIANMKATLLEKCEKNTATFRKLRESFFINKFDTKNKGLNKK
jgi:peptide-methionine (R)-S-oxide reductase